MPLILAAVVLPIIGAFIIYKVVKLFYKSAELYKENREEDREWAAMQEKEQTPNNDGLKDK
jgi:hypothetical protein